MRALVYTGTEASEMREVPAPEPSAGQAVVQVARCGLCGSDMHAWHGHDPRRVPPLVLGHEAVGSVVDGPRRGARVAINPLMTCGACAACRSGATHLCPARELIGMRVPGAFAESVAVNAANLVVLPDGLPFERAVLAEPLAVSLHAWRLGLARLGPPAAEMSVTVLGGGAIGLLAALVARAEGAGTVRIAETGAGRRAMLQGLFAEGVYDPAATPGPESSADLVIDAVGSGRTRAAASTLARPGGAIVHVGLQDNAEGLDTRRLTLWEIAFLGSYCYSHADFVEAVGMLADGRIDGAGWVEARPLDDGPRAFRDVDAGTAPPKIVLVP